VSIRNKIIDTIESELEKLKGSDALEKTQEAPTVTNAGVVDGKAPGPVSTLEAELAQALLEMIPPVYDNTHPYAPLWDRAKLLIAQVSSKV
jgi:hypothetical protein